MLICRTQFAYHAQRKGARMVGAWGERLGCELSGWTGGLVLCALPLVLGLGEVGEHGGGHTEPAGDGEDLPCGVARLVA